MIDGLVVEREVKKMKCSVENLISGIYAIVFTIVFLLTSIVVGNWGIFIVGGGLTLVATAFSHMSYGFEKETNNDIEYVVRIDEKVSMIEFYEKYKIIEDLGRGLYRVAPRQTVEVTQ